MSGVGCARCQETPTWVRNADGRLERCPCQREASIHRAIAHARIPARYLRSDLDHFVTYAENERLAQALERTKQFAAAFPAVEKGLCFIGPAGIGKTHLAVAALRLVIERTAARGLFYDVRDLLKLIRSTYNPAVQTAEADILRPVMDAELLVLDDFGAEKTSEWVEETLTLIIATRYNDQRPTILTTNYEDTPGDQDLNSLRARVGFRIHSRLHQMCEFLEFSGGDYRDLPPNGGAADLAALWRAAGRRPAHRLGSVTPGRARAQARAAYPPPTEKVG